MSNKRGSGQLEGTGKPSIETVIEYAIQTVNQISRKYSQYIPPEHLDEIRQEASLRVLRYFEALDVERGWKAWCQQHARGALLDYLRDGSGFGETAWALISEDDDSEASPKRIGGGSANEDQSLDVEAVAAIHGVFHSDLDGARLRPKWELIARLSRVDEDVHLVAKLLLGFSRAELAKGFGTSQKRLSQRAIAFFESLKRPIRGPWCRQVIYAFGLCEYFQVPENDNGEGWGLEPVDLFDPMAAAGVKADYRPEFDFMRTSR